MVSDFQRFLEEVQRSGLIDEDRLNIIAAGISNGNMQADDSQRVATLTQRLVETGVMTSWQCDQIAKGNSAGLVFQKKYKLLQRLPNGTYHYAYRGLCIASSANVDIVFISYGGQTTVAVIRACQLVDTQLVWLARYHETFFAPGKYERRGTLFKGNHNSTMCYGHNRTTRELVQIAFVPMSKAVSVYITKPRAIIEIGLASWAPYSRF